MGIETDRVELTASQIISMLLPLLASILFWSWGNAVQVSKQAGKDCPVGWVDATTDGLGCLFFSSSKATWEGAASSCQDSGASLLEIWTELELDFVRTWLQAFADSGIDDDWWIGGTDQEREGEWYWVGTLAPVPEFVWYPEGPDHGTSQNCLMMENSIAHGGNFFGNDYICSIEEYFICQKHLFY